MGYCPHCGSEVYPDETFCIHCGEKLPDQLEDRLHTKKWSIRSFMIPLLLSGIMIITSIIIVFFNHHQQTEALTYYQHAEEHILNKEYQEADQALEHALSRYDDFPQAEDLYEFTQFTTDVLNEMDNINAQQAQLQFLQQAKRELERFSGEAYDLFLEDIQSMIIDRQISHVKDQLENDPSMDELPVILWETEAIDDPEAYDLAQEIRDQISAYTIDNANEYLQQNQFSEARDTIQSGLYYLPNDDKLESLLATVDREQTLFEDAQDDRMKQAYSEYEDEMDINENHAVQINDLEINIENSRVEIAGEVESSATIPIHAVKINYSLLDDDESSVDTFELYVYPETLYPNEIGHFDHTHFDEELANQTTDYQIESITWLLD
ncbi:zinc-ribbon domain-containing protein [Pelagirhabdus alkalitolerans]|uniref:Zinc-ribbon domain-containing protein n=1 Tax=Pelagirhabdus alkalitolerans TaxID=1612202 RepID=A0A1G6GY64_9BACI|nr:zinc ribbon domain-containing protein [Pelagirhabdus alkalitolerans]SDB87000.1 zinc-ribbon domain-containing protein [Pelagirhabdus alkalitolerans]